MKGVRNRIRLIRWLCAATLVCGTAAFFLLIEAKDSQSPRGEDAGLLDREASVVLQDVKYQEVRDGRTHWQLHADSACLYRERQTTVLTNIRAVFYLESGDTLELHGQRGILANDSKDLEVSGEVRLRYDGGYTLETARLFYRNRSGIIHTPEMVVVQGPGLRLTGVGMKVDTRGRLVRVLSRVQTTWESGLPAATGLLHPRET